MNLVDGYFMRTENGRAKRVLMENAPVYRPVRDGQREVLEYEVRPVAGFPKGVAGSVIREIAKLDSRSRDLTLPPVERGEALRELAERFKR